MLEQNIAHAFIECLICKKLDEALLLIGELTVQKKDLLDENKKLKKEREQAQKEKQQALFSKISIVWVSVPFTFSLLGVQFALIFTTVPGMINRDDDSDDKGTNF